MDGSGGQGWAGHGLRHRERWGGGSDRICLDSRQGRVRKSLRNRQRRHDCRSDRRRSDLDRGKDHRIRRRGSLSDRGHPDRQSRSHRYAGWISAVRDGL